jgi:hypothetical protein
MLLLLSLRRCGILSAVAVLVVANLGSIVRLFLAEQRSVSAILQEPTNLRTEKRNETEASSTEEAKRNVTMVTLEGRAGMGRLITRYNEDGNLFCELIDELRSADPHVLIQFNITFGCQELFHAGCGTGNFLQLLYGLRFTCPDAETTRQHLILPWMTGFYLARSGAQASAFSNLAPAAACGGVFQQPLGHMVPAMQRDLRHMAVALVGRSPGLKEDVEEKAPSFVPQISPAVTLDPPPFADVEWDDAVIHFRCGDLMDSGHPSFAFMNFRGYTRPIARNTTTSIGILTSPYDPGAGSVRRVDARPQIQERCRIVVASLQEYVREQFPQARVRIHTEDSIALTYVRMILAQQVVAGISTFGVMPAVATFGTGYLRIPDHPDEVNQWLLKPRIDEIVDNVVFIKGAKTPVQHIQALWQQEGAVGVLAWFWNDTGRPHGRDTERVDSA